ncbi:MAG TPA: hypothetical protein VJN21_15010 [Candidatus Acidoferrales bacterium]|nr:hypothetical protein [Candidatus Acidoferrales bacterium]
MNKSCVAGMATIAAVGMYLAVGISGVRAQDQSQDMRINPNSAIKVMTSEGDESLHVSEHGCHGSVSGPGTYIGIDDRCSIWSDTENVPRGMDFEITADEISFVREGKHYRIRDAATVKQARNALAPLVSALDQQNALGAKQRALGEQQRALGQKQREFGRQQRDVKVSVPDMSADFKKVEADAKRLNEQGGTQSDLGDLQSELGDLQSKLGELQSQAGDVQSKFGDQQSKLADQQSALGDQQSDLGDQQSALGEKAESVLGEVLGKVRDVLAQAVKSGTAKPE